MTIVLIILCVLLVSMTKLAINYRHSQACWADYSTQQAEEFAGACLQAEQQFLFAQKQAATSWQAEQTLALINKVAECEHSASFYFAHPNGEPLPPFHAGQYLTFSFSLPNTPEPVVRCYSISEYTQTPSHYRVTVKRMLDYQDKHVIPTGLISNYLHDNTKVGDRIAVQAPQGKFTLKDTATPLVLIAGGIGITPLFSIMQEALTHNPEREIWLLYAVYNGTQHPLKDEINTFHSYANVRIQTVYRHPLATDRLGIDYDHSTLINRAHLQATLPSNNYAFYLCGPPAMLESLLKELTAWGVPVHDIYYEAFGPASIKRDPQASILCTPHPVEFTVSNIEASWQPADGTLLEFAEALGLHLRFGCRAGRCGTCALDLGEGQVEYITEPEARIQPGKCLVCIAKPKQAVKVSA